MAEGTCNLDPAKPTEPTTPVEQGGSAGSEQSAAQRQQAPPNAPMHSPIRVENYSGYLPGEGTPLRTGREFDPDKTRELMRGAIALALLLILLGVITCSFFFIFKIAEGIKNTENAVKSIDMLTDVLTVIFGPLIALVAAATGFYYGGQQNKPEGNR